LLGLCALISEVLGNFPLIYLSVQDMTNSGLFLTAILTAIVMVVAALVIAFLLAPRSFNALKGEPYECGIPTRGSSWMQFRVGYYLFAILYLVFDVETVLLFPWAVIMRDLGTQGLVCVSFFLVVLALGLAYAWKKGALVWK
jgi:NADH-quinone oxidoreductase subunit A